MARYLLDTNIVSFLLKGNAAVIRRFQRTPVHEMVLSVVVEAELRYGAQRLDAGAKVHTVLPEFLRRAQILPWDSLCAQRYAELRAALETGGESIGHADTMIAAHALALGSTLVTNDKAFRRVEGLAVEDWSKGPQRA